MHGQACEAWCASLTLQDGELVAPYQDLDLIAGCTPWQQPEQRDDTGEGEVGESQHVVVGQWRDSRAG
jgi:hypothetical protein